LVIEKEDEEAIKREIKEFKLHNVSLNYNFKSTSKNSYPFSENFSPP